MIYLFTGQPGSGKTTLAKKLQFWLQTDKKNWRKSVFHIDDEDTSFQLEIAKYLDKCGNDVVISSVFPNKEIREKFKSNYKVQEIYCHTKKMRNGNIVTNYEPPTEFFISLETSESVDASFSKLIKLLV